MSGHLSPNFQRLAWSNLLAQSAEQLSLAAVPIVAVLLLQAGPGEIGLLASIQSLPFLLLSMPLGLLADRTSRTRLMALAETLRALALLLLLALIVTGQVSIMALAAIGFLAAVGTVAFSVAAPSLVPALVPAEGLARANGRLELARSAAFAAGPALAGADRHADAAHDARNIRRCADRATSRGAIRTAARRAAHCPGPGAGLRATELLSRRNAPLHSDVSRRPALAARPLPLRRPMLPLAHPHRLPPALRPRSATRRSRACARRSPNRRRR